MKTVEEMFSELIHYGDYDYLITLDNNKLVEVYNGLFGEEE